MILAVLLVGCESSTSNYEYYRMSSGMGWEPRVTPEDLDNYVSWEKAIDMLIASPERVEAVGQGHSLQVNIVFKDKIYIQTIEPDIDTIFMVLDKCGAPCEHIEQITQ